MGNVGKKLIGAALICLLLCATAWAVVSITIGWNASIDPSVTGYKVYWGTTSRNYGAAFDAGKNVQLPLSALPNSGPVFVAATAYNTKDESGFSDELVLWGINGSADANAIINHVGPDLYEQESSITFTMSAKTGYKIEDVKVDGQSVGAVSSYTFAALSANHAISVTSAKLIDPPTKLRKIVQFMAIQQGLPSKNGIREAQ